MPRFSELFQVFLKTRRPGPIEHVSAILAREIPKRLHARERSMFLEMRRRAARWTHVRGGRIAADPD
jgi:hypothetical protein